MVPLIVPHLIVTSGSFFGRERKCLLSHFPVQFDICVEVELVKLPVKLLLTDPFEAVTPFESRSKRTRVVVGYVVEHQAAAALLSELLSHRPHLLKDHFEVCFL